MNIESNLNLYWIWLYSWFDVLSLEIWLDLIRWLFLLMLIKIKLTHDMCEELDLVIVIQYNKFLDQVTGSCLVRDNNQKWNLGAQNFFIPNKDFTKTMFIENLLKVKINFLA